MQPALSLLRAFPRPATCRAALRCSALRYSTAAPSALPSTSTPTPPSKSKHLKDASRTAKTVPFTPATQPQLPLSPPAYHVGRTKTKNLPIYTDFKRGGNLHLTTVSKVTGDPHALREELRAWLGKKDEHVTVNALTRHVVVKGHHVPQITEFLKGRGF